MKYTVYLELSFDEKKEATKLLNYVEKIKEKAYKDGGTNNEVPLAVKTELWETHHDEDPPKQCVRVDRVKFNKMDEKIHI